MSAPMLISDTRYLLFGKSGRLHSKSVC